jgi:hypothetical protein
VTFSPVGLDTVKLDVDTPVTLPTDPPAAFVDLALDPPEDRVELGEALACVAVAEALVVAAELDVPPHAASPIPSAGTHSASPIARMRVLDGRRRRLARPGWC